jgi:hypothetical protein
VGMKNELHFLLSVYLFSEFSTTTMYCARSRKQIIMYFAKRMRGFGGGRTCKFRQPGEDLRSQLRVWEQAPLPASLPRTLPRETFVNKMNGLSSFYF